MNPFVTILLSKGYSESPTGRWLPPDFKQGNAALVEVEDLGAVILNDSLGSLFLNTPEDLLAFRECV
jgi:hypothetical protein